MVWFIFGAICGIAVCIPVIIISRRNGGDNKGGIKDAIRREKVLNRRIAGLQTKVRESRSEVSNARREISDTRKRIALAENRVRTTDSLVERLKKDNNLE